MANSRVAIMNLALQLLGAPRVGAPDEDSKNAIETNACFDILRDYEQRANAWNFTLCRAVLAPSATAPAFTYAYAFPLPVNPFCLRVLLPSRTELDWKIEYHTGAPAILTNDATAIYLRYIGRIEDEAIFDPMFTVMLACSIAWHCCETITQSNSKKAALLERYSLVRREARRMNAFEKVPDKNPVGSWVTAGMTGSLVDASWGQE